MNKERFHNALALNLGYDRIVNDRRLLISVEESDDPLVTLKVDGCEDVTFKASQVPEDLELPMEPEMRDKVKMICDTVYLAYIESASDSFASYNGIR